MANVTVSNDRYTVDPLYQWDLNRTLQIYGLSLASIPEIHFTNDAMDRAIVRQATMDAAGVISVDVPNSLLQKPYKIRAYICIHEGDSFKSLYLITIPVEARSRPNDYTISVSDDEIYSFNALENKLENTLALSLERYDEVNQKYEDVNRKYSEALHVLEETLNEANTLKDSAETIYNNVVSSEQKAKTSEESAKASEENAKTSATSASKSADTATTKASEARASAENASESAINAENAKNEAENVRLAVVQAVERGEFDGKSAYAYAKEGGYTGTESKFSEDINPDNIKNNAETFIVSELSKRQQLKPEFVTDVKDMIDTSKVYVLAETNEIWGYIKRQVIIPESNRNVFDKSTALINQRMSASGAISTTNGAKGSFITDYIELTNWANASSPYNMNINFVLQSVGLAATTAVFYDENKTYIGGVTCGLTNNAQNVTLRDTESVIDLKLNKQAANNLVDYPNAKYVRIQLFKKESQTAITASDLDDVVITLDANKIPESVTEEYVWTSTGHTFVPADNEERIIDLEEETRRLVADVINLQNNVGSGSTSVIVPNFWENAVNECIAKIKALQVGKNCVTFPFFSDNHQRNGYAGVLIAKVMKECGIPYCFFGGDTIGSGYIADEATMIVQDRAFDATMSYIPDGRFCRAVGNHDGYWAVSSTEKYRYSREQIYELFLRAESTAQNKFFGDGTYYYVDDTVSKVRWIILDSNSIPIGAGSEIIDADQLSWLQNTALKFNESGWAVVIISHCPIANPYHANVTNAREVISLIQSYKNSTNANKAEIVGWFSGHIHRDRIYTNLYVNGDSLGYVGEPDISLGFTQVTITSDRTDIAYKNDDLSESATKHPVDDSDQSHAIDFVTINKTTRTVNITRLGIGDDRSYTY